MKFTVSVTIKAVVETDEPEDQAELVRFVDDIRERLERGEQDMDVVRRHVDFIRLAEPAGG